MSVAVLLFVALAAGPGLAFQRERFPRLSEARAMREYMERLRQLTPEIGQPPPPDYREEDDESLASWKVKEARMQEYLEKLREIRLAELQTRSQLLQQSMNSDITPLVVPPPRHRPQKWLPANPEWRPLVPRPLENRPVSEFAVPPSDPKFFDTSRIQSTSVESVSEDSSDSGWLLSSSTDSVGESGVYKTPISADDDNEYMIFIAAVAGSSLFVVLMLGFIGLAIYKFQKNVKAAANVDYPAYGVTGPNSRDREGTPTGDRKLAQSAQMYHYQITKQQILSMENTGGGGGAESEADSEDENEEDYTVYECPGLAPAGEMEVKNPLFVEDPTPALVPTESKPTTKETQEKPK